MHVSNGVSKGIAMNRVTSLEVSLLRPPVQLNGITLTRPGALLQNGASALLTAIFWSLATVFWWPNLDVDLT